MVWMLKSAIAFLIGSAGFSTLVDCRMTRVFSQHLSPLLISESPLNYERELSIYIETHELVVQGLVSELKC